MQQLELAIAVHEEWLAAGRPSTPDELVAQHPTLAEVLQALLADRDEVEQAVAAADSEARVLGDFRIIGELGRGGMGVVYRARQRSLDREVALKVLPNHVTLDPDAVARFRREATIAARLEHPNIVAIHAVGRDGDTHFFAMELVDGAPLDRLNARTGQPRTVRNCVELCTIICDALAHAHALGVLHRDVKPSNILVRKDGTPVLTDFGLARDVDLPSLTRTGAFAGTPHYSSPEQAAGRRAIDARADVWSLGATLYELLTGRLPFEGSSAAEVIERIGRVEPKDPLQWAPGLAPDLAAIVMKALEKDSERRYGSAAAFGADLRAFLEFRPVSARRATRWLRLRRWIRREPMRAAFAGVLALGVPTVSLIASILIANRNAMQVGALEIQRQEREERLARLMIDLEAGDYVAAMTSAKLALEERPDDIEAHVLQALVQVYSGSGDALHELETAIERRRLPYGDRARVVVLTAMHRIADADAIAVTLAEPQAPEELYFYGCTMMMRGQDRGLDVAEWRRVQDMLLRAILLSPTRRQHYYIKWAAAASWTGDAAAIAHCNTVLLELWPQSPAALLYVASSLNRSEPVKAMALYRQVLQAGHEHPRIYANIAKCLTNAKDPVGARAAREEAIAAYGRREAAGLLSDTECLNLVISLFELGRPQEALERVRSVIAKRPDIGRAHRLLGWLLTETKDYPGAIAALERATQLDANDADGFERLGKARFQLGDIANAVVALRRCTELLPNRALAHRTLAAILLEAKDFAGAVAPSRRAIALDAKSAEGHYLLGAALVGAGDVASSAAPLQSALSLLPTYSLAARKLADLQAAAGDRAAAIGTYRACIDAGNKEAVLSKGLGAVLLQDGQAAAGLAALREAVARAVATQWTVEFLRGIATMAREAGDGELVRASLRRALEFDPTAAQRAEIEQELAKCDR